MLRVKICGVTRAEDATLAAELGADAIGMVFYEPSPRSVFVPQAIDIVQHLPPWVARIGVFVDADIARVREVVDQVGLTAVQLHGAETPEYIAALGLNVPIIKAMKAEPGWQERLTAYAGLPILLDHAGAGSPGGTGEMWDWDSFDPSVRPDYFILAGGLTPENIAAAVNQLSPDAIDVASGVEREPGIKDKERLKAFLKAVAPFRAAGTYDG